MTDALRTAIAENTKLVTMNKRCRQHSKYCRVEWRENVSESEGDGGQVEAFDMSISVNIHY